MTSTGPEPFTYGIIVCEPEIAAINAVTARITRPIFHAYQRGEDICVWIIASRQLSATELDTAYNAWMTCRHG
jgi:hypothetical protein